MRRVVLLALCALALPTVALATTVDYSSSAPTGTVMCTGSCSSPSAGSTFVLDFTGLSIDGSLQGAGSIVFDITVGAKGSIAGSTVTVIGPSSTTLFSGTFSSGAITVLAPGEFGLVGNVNGITMAGFFSTGPCAAVGESVAPSNVLCGVGSADVSDVPEPGTLSLLGTGLIGLAGVVRRKLRG
jgi:PEP-CTERM motif-containing protein